jgi:hypothetical protein
LNVLLISYALRTLAVDYSPLYQAIKRNSATWWHFLDDTWIIETNMTADDLGRLLITHISTNDSLIVVRITPEHQGWLPQIAWDWLNKRQY